MGSTGKDLYTVLGDPGDFLEYAISKLRIAGVRYHELLPTLKELGRQGGDILCIYALGHFSSTEDGYHEEVAEALEDNAIPQRNDDDQDSSLHRLLIPIRDKPSEYVVPCIRSIAHNCRRDGFWMLEIAIKGSMEDLKRYNPGVTFWEISSNELRLGLDNYRLEVRFRTIPKGALS
jgi:hypothetical protein